MLKLNVKMRNIKRRDPIHHQVMKMEDKSGEDVEFFDVKVLVRDNEMVYGGPQEHTTEKGIEAEGDNENKHVQQTTFTL
jgi:hypothetical protein